MTSSTHKCPISSQITREPIQYTVTLSLLFQRISLPSLFLRRKKVKTWPCASTFQCLYSLSGQLWCIKGKILCQNENADSRRGCKASIMQIIANKLNEYLKIRESEGNAVSKSISSFHSVLYTNFPTSFSHSQTLAHPPCSL